MNNKLIVMALAIQSGGVEVGAVNNSARKYGAYSHATYGQLTVPVGASADTAILRILRLTFKSLCRWIPHYFFSGFISISKPIE